MNLYDILGVPRDADDETLRNAYRALARQYHPDRGLGSSAEKFRHVNEAYETLINPARRHMYDLSLRWMEPRITPTITRSGHPAVEDAAVFGTFSVNPQRRVFRTAVGLDEVFDRYFSSFDDLFFGPEWPW